MTWSVAFTAPGRAEVVDGVMPVRRAGEALVRPLYVGLCGTDSELLMGTMPYYRTGEARMPLQPGHEFSALVVESDDPNIAPGTYVVGDPVVGCGSCMACAGGRPTHCAGRFEIGVRGGMPGAAAELITVPTLNLFPIPANVSAREAVLAEPSVTVLAGLARSGDPAGRTALVVGAGTLGLIAAQCLVAAGAEVSVAMRHQTRETSVRRLGAEPILVDHREAASAEGFDLVVEAGGTSEAVNLAIHAVARGGQVVLLGVPPAAVDGFDVAAVVIKDVTLHGVLNGPGRYRDALEYIARSVIRPTDLIDSEFPLSRLADALARLSESGRVRPKVLLDLQQTAATAPRAGHA